MTISFCGRGNFCPKAGMQQKLLQLLDNIIGDEQATFLLGECGGFDTFAYNCCKAYQAQHPTVRVYLVVAYCKSDAPTLYYSQRSYDDILFPPLNIVSKSLAIIHRNQWMVDKADILICPTGTSSPKIAQYAQKQHKAVEYIK